MAKLFIGVALAFMVVTAALGFLAKGNIDKLQSTLKGTKGDLAKEQTATQTAKNDLKKSQEERDAANTKAEEATKSLADKDRDLMAANQQRDEAKAADMAKAGEITRLMAENAQLKNNPIGTGEKMEDPRVAALTQEAQTAKAELAEAKAVLDSTVKKGEEDRTKLADLQRKESDRLKGVQRPGLQGRILAVNAGWNFVVLSVGDKQGVIVNAPLLVVRNNTPIARLRITSVEASSSIADLIPGSVARGVTVQPGDTVIFEGRSAVGETKAGADTDAAAPALPAR